MSRNLLLQRSKESLLMTSPKYTVAQPPMAVCRTTWKQHGVVGIADVDTRMLVRHVRNKGAMNAVISSDLTPDQLEAKLKEVPSMEGLELASVVSTEEIYHVGEEDAPLKVSVLDLGIKSSILSNLAKRGCYCKVFPAKTSFEEDGGMES